MSNLNELQDQAAKLASNTDNDEVRQLAEIANLTIKRLLEELERLKDGMNAADNSFN